MLGAAVALRLVLARTDSLGIAITDASAYPNGFQFRLMIRSRLSFDELGLETPLPGPSRRLLRLRRLGELPPDLFRLGVEFSNGRRATTLGRPAFSAEDEPEGPVLLEHAGHGGDGSFDQDYWVWPLPPPGPLAFVCEWPAAGVGLTRVEVDAGLVLDAAQRAEPLWGASPA